VWAKTKSHGNPKSQVTLMALDQHVVKCKLQFVVVVVNNNKKTF
jgi:hypothetical protein